MYSLLPKSVTSYKFLIFNTYHKDTLYLRGQGCEGLLLFSKTKGVGEQKKSFGNTPPKSQLCSSLLRSSEDILSVRIYPERRL